MPPYPALAFCPRDILNNWPFRNRLVTKLRKPASSASLQRSYPPAGPIGFPVSDGRTYALASNSFLRLTNRLTSAQVTNRRCAFFFSPR